MNNSSFFIENKALFGSFPTQDSVNELEKNGVVHFINLTYDQERFITPYCTNYYYYSYPIWDKSIPTNWYKFSKFIKKILKTLKKLEKGEKIYIHCKGGHGRSGVLVACILKLYHNLDVETALSMTNFYHSQRVNLKDRWKKIGFPANTETKEILLRTFSNHCTFIKL